MKIVKKLIVVLLAVLTFASAFSLVGCTPSKAKDLIVGTWVFASGVGMTLYADGTQDTILKDDSVVKSTFTWEYKGEGTNSRGHYYLFRIGGTAIGTFGLYDDAPDNLYDSKYVTVDEPEIVAPACTRKKD